MMRPLSPFRAGLLLLGLLSASCAHTDEVQQKRDKDQERETAMLKERLLRIERRLSDLDAKLSLVIDEDPPGRSRRVSSQDSRIAGPTYADSRLPPPPEEKTRMQIGIGSEAVDIGTGIDSVGSGDATESGGGSTDTPDGPGVGPEDSGPTVTIDAGLLKQFDLAPSQKGKTLGAPGKKAKGKLPRNVKALYRSAHTALDAGAYDEAVRRFKAVETRFAQHHLADNALYWRGVCYQRGGNAQHAVDVFQTLPKRFPQSPKIPDSLFNLAEIAEAGGDKVLARTIYQRLVDAFPDAERAPEAAAAVRRLAP